MLLRRGGGLRQLLPYYITNGEPHRPAGAPRPDLLKKGSVA